MRLCIETYTQNAQRRSTQNNSKSEQLLLSIDGFLLEGVAFNPSLNLSDGMHPNREGTIVISETLKKNIKTFKKYMNKNYKKEYMFKAFEFFLIFQKDKT